MALISVYKYFISILTILTLSHSAFFWLGLSSQITFSPIQMIEYALPKFQYSFDTKMMD